jgi:hypothetical protein
LDRPPGGRRAADRAQKDPLDADPLARRARPRPCPLCLRLSLASAPAARAADNDLAGNWKLVVTLGPFQEGELALLTVKDQGNKPTAGVKDVQLIRGPADVTSFDVKDGAVNLGMEAGGMKMSFRGKPIKPGTLHGVFNINEQNIPARLEKTDSDKLNPPGQANRELIQGFLALRNMKDPKERAAAARALIAKAPGLSSAPLYADLLRDPAAAGLSQEDVRALVKEWVDSARSYDDVFVADATTQVVDALSKYKDFAPVALEFAKEADKAVAEGVSLQSRANLLSALATAAKAAGNAEIAADATARSAKMDAQLDEEYHQKVPPFKPEESAAAKDRKSDRIVLMELFTGAQCPPCVAADVAFDALIDTYKPVELVTLQYHLHIPGPDPLTNKDTESRAKYYPDLRGTPSTFFDGQTKAGGGGGMSGAKGKYDEYKKIIDEGLAGDAKSTIELRADRSGDNIKISAQAVTRGDKKDGGKLRLRLALTEEKIRYVGGNNLRFHHHVVRALPGGVDGAELTDGQGKTEVTVNLAELRQSLEAYLSDYTKAGRSFPKALPPIDLKNLSVVAFVQDDSDKSVLNTAIVPVRERENP